MATKACTDYVLDGTDLYNLKTLDGHRLILKIINGHIPSGGFHTQLNHLAGTPKEHAEVWNSQMLQVWINKLWWGVGTKQGK